MSVHVEKTLVILCEDPFSLLRIQCCNTGHGQIRLWNNKTKFRNQTPGGQEWTFETKECNT